METGKQFQPERLQESSQGNALGNKGPQPKALKGRRNSLDRSHTRLFHWNMAITSIKGGAWNSRKQIR
jgi:hypothetical protein